MFGGLPHSLEALDSEDGKGPTQVSCVGFGGLAKGF